MKWIKLTLETVTSAEDLISCMLADLGIEGIEIEDKVPLSEKDTKGMFIDILPDLGEDDGIARINFYVDEDTDIAALKKNIEAGLEELGQYAQTGSGRLFVSETEDKDWINNWKQYFRPFYVDDILIKPTWEDLPEGADDKLLIQIDPGTAFGTGKHETTQLCIRQLKKYVKPGDRVLDIGTGSGILGITALKLGAESVFGTDLDENAIMAVGENLAANNMQAESFAAVQGNIIDDEAVKTAAGTGYDIAVANILAPVIIMLTETAGAHIKPGGLFITSGIIDTKEADVLAAFDKSADLEVVEVVHMGEWVSVTARKRA